LQIQLSNDLQNDIIEIAKYAKIPLDKQPDKSFINFEGDSCAKTSMISVFDE